MHRVLTAVAATMLATLALGVLGAIPAGAVTVPPNGTGPPPTDLVATPGNGSASFGWNPSSVSTYIHEGYGLLCSPPPGTPVVVPSTASPSATFGTTSMGWAMSVPQSFPPQYPLTLTGLTNGVTLTCNVYDEYVLAGASHGWLSAPSNTVTVTPGANTGTSSSTSTSTGTGSTTPTPTPTTTCTPGTVPAGSVAGMAADPATGGYWLVTSAGEVVACGAPSYGSVSSSSSTVVDITSTPGGHGYWIVTADGSVVSFGSAHFYGSMGGRPLNKPVVGVTVDPATGGYRLDASDGGIFSFHSPFYGSMGGRPLNKPVVGIASTRHGNGYWEVASDGGIFSFGSARFYGSMGGTTLNKPVIGMATDPGTGGYWMVASDGGIFSFHAPFYGSLGANPPTSPVVGFASTSTGNGYWMVDANGQVFAFGGAHNYGSPG